MLRFILGKSGTGKTTQIYNMIFQLLEQGSEKVMLLIPDQSSFESEKALLNLFGAKKAKQVSVFGFSKLCRYAFEQTGHISSNIIDDGTRSIIMNLALEQLTDKLSLLKGKDNRAISEVMLQTLVECKKNSVSTDMLRACADKVQGDTLKTKLNETALILDTFDALVAQSYVDPLDDLMRLYNILLENNLFKDYIIFVDSFSGFTSQQLKVVRLLLSQCKNIYIALTIDPLSKRNEDIFLTSYNTMRQLTQIADKDFVDIQKPIELLECKRFKSKELLKLEQGIFRNDYEETTQPTNDITIYTAENLYDECEFAARQIKRLVIEEGYLYSDITIISHDLDRYNGILDSIFDKYEIPYFMDTKKDVEVKPVVRFVMSFFRIILNDFDREDVVSLLKTGLTQNTEDEINIFENYLYVWNINNSAFKSNFTLNPSGFSETFSEQDKQSLEIAEKVRRSVVEPALKFKNDSKDKNGREITELLYNTLTSTGVCQALVNLYDELDQEGKGAVGAEQIQIWNKLVNAFDKMVAVTSDMRLPLSRYYELLMILISSMKLSEVPQKLDSVNVTTAQRVRLSNQRASFLIGCTDGEFPAVPHASGVFSSYELKILTNSDLKISQDFEELSSLESFMAYCCMTSAGEKLFLSYPTADLTGNQFKQSEIINQVKKIFKNAVFLDSTDFCSIDNSLWTIGSAFEKYAQTLKHGGEIPCIEKYFMTDSKYADKLQSLKLALDSSPFKIENTENSHKLFGDNLRISASQIEKFNMCRFSYFCNYGLRVRPQYKAEINPMEYGTLVHFIFEKFFTTYSKAEYKNMSDEEIVSFIDTAINDYTEDYFGGSSVQSGSFLYKLSVLKDNLYLLIKRITGELSESDFDVADCELKIGSDIPAYTIKLSTGENIAVCGSVDRVDIMEIDGVSYLRIVDYKTNDKKFKLSDLLYGLNLQMLLYLCSINSNGKQRYGNTAPAGILYMPAVSPSLSAGKAVKDKDIENKLNKDLKMNGLLLDDIKVIKGMEKSGKGNYIPVKIQLDTPVSKSSLATLEQFGKIFKIIDLTIAEMGKDLYNGRIEASPVKGAYDPCKYCPYDSVCAYHMSEPKNVLTLDNAKTFEIIDRELSDRGDE